MVIIVSFFNTTDLTIRHTSLLKLHMHIHTCIWLDRSKINDRNGDKIMHRGFDTKSKFKKGKRKSFMRQKDYCQPNHRFPFWLLLLMFLTVSRILVERCLYIMLFIIIIIKINKNKMIFLKRWSWPILCGGNILILVL